MTTRCLAAALALAFVSSACALQPRPTTALRTATQERTATATLNGKPLELHLAAPVGQATTDALIVYASGDGGWFGSAVDMFRRIAAAGYYTVGFSSRAFLKLDRPMGRIVNLQQLSSEYEQIVMSARTALRLNADTPVILTGWSRGAALAVLAASAPGATFQPRGVVAIGLSDGEDLELNGPDDETDDGGASESGRRWPFEPYAAISLLGPIRCAVIQASGDNYLAAAKARELFGPDSDVRRFYAIEAKNHRFSGGKADFDRALLEAIQWMARETDE